MSVQQNENTSVKVNNVFLEDVVNRSRGLAEEYRSQHAGIPGLSPESRAVLAEARLQLLLRAERQSLDGIFEKEDLLTLLNLSSGQYFHPDAIVNFWWTAADDVYDEEDFEPVCDEQDIESVHGGGIGAKLQSLTLVQTLALTDLIELVWTEVGTGLHPVEAAKKLGWQLN